MLLERRGRKGKKRKRGQKWIREIFQGYSITIKSYYLFSATEINSIEGGGRGGGEREKEGIILTSKSYIFKVLFLFSQEGGRGGNNVKL